MKVGLISPKRGPLIAWSEFREFFESSQELSARAETIYKWPELGLLTLAGLMPNDFEIKYIDDYRDGVNYDEPFDLVGITALTPKVTRAYEIAGKFRKRGVYVIMGGPHVSVLPQEALDYADSVMVGEAQVLWDEFFSDFQAGRPKRIYQAAKLSDMTKSPLPRYDLLNVDYYKNIPIETTRGCPHDCMFCSSTRLWGKDYRTKTVDQVLRELEMIKKVAPHKYLFFVDDNMFVNRKFSYELLAAMRGINNLRWFTQTDISIASDDRLLDLAYQAGCREVLIGFETLSADNLKTVDSSQWKLKQFASYPWAIKKIQSSGIAIYGSFVLGLDHDDEQTFTTVRDFILSNQLLGFQILIATPIPGTRLYEQLLAEGRLTNQNDWNKYTTYQLNYELKKIDSASFHQKFLTLFKELYNDKASIARKKHYINILKNLAT